MGTVIPQLGCRTVICSWLCLALAAVCPGEEHRDDNVTEVELLPGERLYPAYAADPHRVTFSVQKLFYTDTDVAESGSPRFGLKSGGRFGIVRLQPQGRPERALQVSLEGGFDGQFDADHSLDNIGWDGNYGLLLRPLNSVMRLRI